jgi:hypothetical protein
VNVAGSPANTPVSFAVPLNEPSALIAAEGIESSWFGVAPPGVQPRMTVGMVTSCRLVLSAETSNVRPYPCQVAPE